MAKNFDAPVTRTSANMSPNPNTLLCPRREDCSSTLHAPCLPWWTIFALSPLVLSYCRCRGHSQPRSRGPEYFMVLARHDTSSSYSLLCQSISSTGMVEPTCSHQSLYHTPCCPHCLDADLVLLFAVALALGRFILRVVQTCGALPSCGRVGLLTVLRFVPLSCQSKKSRRLAVHSKKPALPSPDAHWVYGHIGSETRVQVKFTGTLRYLDFLACK